MLLPTNLSLSPAFEHRVYMYPRQGLNLQPLHPSCSTDGYRHTPSHPDETFEKVLVWILEVCFYYILKIRSKFLKITFLFYHRQYMNRKGGFNRPLDFIAWDLRCWRISSRSSGSESILYFVFHTPQNRILVLPSCKVRKSYLWHRCTRCPQEVGAPAAVASSAHSPFVLLLWVCVCFLPGCLLGVLKDWKWLRCKFLQ